MLATTILGDVSDYAYRKIIGPVPTENVVTIFPHTSAGLALFVVLAVLIAPLLEETFFRGFVFQGLSRSWGPLLGAIVSALVFALWHQQLSVLIPIFGLGLVLAAAFYWTKSIYTNIACHSIFNALGVVAWWFLKTTTARRDAALVSAPKLPAGRRSLDAEQRGLAQLAAAAAGLVARQRRHGVEHDAAHQRRRRR